MMGRLKLILSLAGLVFAVVGIARDDRVIVWAAIALLSAALLLRLALRRRSSRQAIADDEADPSA